jgi:ribosomal protein S18 acetylase RimI-like enzyme
LACRWRGRSRPRIIDIERSDHRDLAIRRAGPEEFDDVFAVVHEAAKWLESRGIPQWRFFLTDAGRDFVRDRIGSGETYLVFDSSHQPIATFRLQWSDQEIWGPRGLDGQAGYVHGLAVRRHAAGAGLGLKLLDLASDLIARNSRPLVRLDCMAANPPLCDFYRRAGFSDLGVGTSNITSKSLRLFERSSRKG